MRTLSCALCGFAHAEEREYSKVVEKLGRRVEVHGLRHFVCPQCEADFTDSDQSRLNLSLVQAAFNEEQQLISAKQIRAWREQIGLTQRVAARIFGGGLNAFSKYETGEVVQSEAMDNLLWLVMREPSLLPLLASRRQARLPEAVLAKCEATTLSLGKAASAVETGFPATVHRVADVSVRSGAPFQEAFPSYRKALADFLTGDHWTGEADLSVDAANARDFRWAETA